MVAVRGRMPQLVAAAGAGGMIYVASRASIPARGAMWRELRAAGAPIISTWIDEDGPGQTVDQADLWVRVMAEVCRADFMIVYAEPDDFPLKGTLIEVGAALACGIEVFCVLPGVDVDLETFRPVGSWINHPLVRRFDTVADALRDRGE